MRIRIHPSVYVYLLSMVVLSSWKACAGAVSALLVHELGHLAVSCLAGDGIDSLELTPFGGVMRYADGRIPSKGIKGICIAAAGPAANYLFLMLLGSVSAELDYEWIRSAASSNAAMICINLLPALPLDGGRIIFCLGYYIFSVSGLITVLSWMGIAAGCGFLLLALYGAVTMGILNLSVVVVGGYLACCACKSRSQIMMENLYAVVEETNRKKDSIIPLKVYAVPGNTSLIRLVPFLSGSCACEFVFSLGAREHRISEEMLRRLILEKPLAFLEDVF